MSASCDISRLLAGLGQARARGEAAAARGLLKFAHHVIGDSQQICPVLTGFLKGSGTVGELERTPDGPRVEAGHNASYAAAVHENLAAHHTQGQAKFLETAVRQNATKMNDFIGGEVRAAL